MKVALSTFTVYVMSSPENVLDANKTFVSLSLFNMLNYPISILPMLINSLVQVIMIMMAGDDDDDDDDDVDDYGGDDVDYDSDGW